MITEKQMNARNLPLTLEQQDNMTRHLLKINQLFAAFGFDRSVTSGVRDIERQKEIDTLAGRIPRLGSKHLHAAATDHEDLDGRLGQFCLDNLPLLRKLGLYMEDLRYCNGYVHLQSIPPRSGKTIFQPYPWAPPKKGL